MLPEDFEQILKSNIDFNQFANKTIFITGANGFLPAYMVETLLLLNKTLLINKKCKVIALARNEKHALSRFKDYLKEDDLEIIVQDVAEELNTNQKIDYIVHAASPASPKHYSADPIGVIMPNVIGTKNTLELAKRNSAQGYLYFSSSEIYGRFDKKQIIDEDTYGCIDPTELRNCYAQSKKMGENICISYAHQHNIPIRIVRPFHVYGPGMKLDDGRVFADFVKNIINNEDITLTSDGSAKRYFCYLSDATIYFFKVLLHGENKNAYNVANIKSKISIKDLAELLIKMYPEKKLKIVFKEKPKNYLPSYIEEMTISTQKLEDLCGSVEQTSIAEGFRKTIGSYT